jgi:long-chain fatty acid transport protein
MGRIFAAPLFLGAKDDMDLDGFGTYPAGVGTRYAWGGGFQAGVYYNTETCWHFGASLKSPQWMEPFRFNTEDQLGNPREVRFRLNYPLIASIGASYTGFEKWILACDLRYFDYANTTGFGPEGMTPQGALTGLDWNNVFAVAIGAQRQLNDCLFVRVGYCFNENPIDSFASQFNVASPLIIKHSLHTGFSYVFADNWMFSLTYVHCFENEVTGPLHGALGPIPNTSVTSTVSADALSMGLSKRF